MKNLSSKLTLFMLAIMCMFSLFTHAQWNKEATLLPGSEFNTTLKEFMGGDPENNIKSIEKSDVAAPSWVTTRMISMEGSEYPVYVWNAWEWHIYYYSEADNVYMNPNSAGMFADMRALTNLDIGDWNTSKVTDMSNMFANCNSLTELDLSNFNTSNVTNMGSMFIYCSSITDLDLGTFDTSKVTNTSVMFGYDTNLRKIYVSSNFVTTKIENSNGMFAGDINLVWWNGTEYDNNHIEVEYARIDKEWQPWYFTQKLDYTMLLPGQSFDGVLKTILGRYSNWDDYSATYATDTEFWNLSIQRVDSIPVWAKTWVISVAESESPVIAGYNGGNTIYYYTQADTIYMNPDSSYMFYTFPLGNYSEDWDTSKVTNMSNMFYWCLHLENLDLSSWDTSKVTDMSNMFTYTQLTTIYVKTWFVTNQVTNSDYMFEWSENLEWWNGTKYDLSHQDKTYARIDKEWQPWYFTEKLDYTMLLPGNLFNTEIKKLAGNASANYDSDDINIMRITQRTWDAIPSWVTTGIISMKGSEYPVYAWFEHWTIYYYTQADKVYMNPNSSYMFFKLKRLGSINIDFDTSKVTNMRGMFQNDISLNSLDLSDWNTSRVTNMQEVFQMNTGLVEVDLSSWETSKVTIMGRMFDNCKNLRTIYVSEWFVTSQLTGIDNPDQEMLNNVSKIVWWNGTRYDSWHQDKTYAKIDKAWQSWYFTDKNAITVKFVNTLDWSETNITTSKWHQIDNIPNVKWYTVKWVYLDEVMTKPIDLSNGVNWYTKVYVKYERNQWWNSGGSSWGWGRWSSSNNSSNTKNNDTSNNEMKWNDKSNNVLSWADVKNDIAKNEKSENKAQIKYKDAREELLAAYYFALMNWITNKSSPENARLDGGLTRIQMAKMLSQFAINVLWQEPDVSRWVANFSDVSKELDKKYSNWVTLAYQLGIMWQNMKKNKFRPYDGVTRAEFATALSRMLYHTQDWTWKIKYYEPHIAKLYSEGILNRVDPKRKEKRWYVMIMLLRSVN